MKSVKDLPYNRAAWITASTFGILAGLGGIRHGIGEILQGNVAPDGVLIDSWAQGPLAVYMSGEPGMTVVPNMLITGILATIISTAVVVWSGRFVQRKNGGRVLIILSTLMLLFGGGFGPPIIGLLAGAAGSLIHSPLTEWRSRLPEGLRSFFAMLWPWIFTISAINSIFLFVASYFLVVSLGVRNEELFLNSFYFAVLSVFLTLFAGIARDLEARRRRLAP